MRSCRVLFVAGLLLLTASAAGAQGTTEDDPLPPEKTQMIYDTLLPKEKAAAGSEMKEETAQQTPTSMTAEKMEHILRERGINLDGRPGSRKFLFEGMQMFLLADQQNNRMRLISPLATLDLLRQDPGFNEIELLQKMLKANYLATGDVRLCINKNIIWAAFLHPLDSLTERDLVSALEQVAETVVKAHGNID